MQGHPMLNLTINFQIFYAFLASLPPTPKPVYDLLQKRKFFKVLFLVQSDFEDNLPTWYNEMEDVIHLSYKKKVDGALFFPKSNLCYGRLSLYIAGRILELRQQWLYNYYIFTDDDAQLSSGYLSIKMFEMDLWLWQPAVAGPLPNPLLLKIHQEIRSVNHIDFVILAYHRESLEVLHPWILDYDENCIWSSQLMQVLEQSMIYRNHIFAFKSLLLGGGNKHREYKRNCIGPNEGFENVFKDMHKVSSNISSQVCFPTGISTFDQLLEIGSPRFKDFDYHLMNRSHIYHSLKAYKNCDNKWNPSDSICCTLDNKKNALVSPRVHHRNQNHSKYEGFPQGTIFKVLHDRKNLTYRLLLPERFVFEIDETFAQSEKIVSIDQHKLQLVTYSKFNFISNITYFYGPEPRWDYQPWKSKWLPSNRPWLNIDFCAPFCIYSTLCKVDDLVIGKTANLERHFTRAWNLNDIVNIIKSTQPKRSLNFVLNYGAADGYGGLADPTFHLFDHENMSGLLIDGQCDDSLFKKYPKRENIKIASCTRIDVFNLTRFLEYNNVPKHITVLKIDVDSYECAIAKNILNAGYISEIIHIEFNPIMKPPLRFSVIPSASDHDKEIWKISGPFYGCSLSMIDDILSSYNYVLLQVDGWDAFYIRKKFAVLFEPLPASPMIAYNIGFLKPFNNFFESYSKDNKLYNDRINNLLRDVSSGLQNIHKDAISKLRGILEESAPRSVSNRSLHPYYFNVF
jgi:hypothetical protein